MKKVLLGLADLGQLRLTIKNAEIAKNRKVTFGSIATGETHD